MIDELQQQIESLENLKAELKYQLQQKDEKINELINKQEIEHKELDDLHQEILNYKTNYVLKSISDNEISQCLETIKERDLLISQYERDIKENLYHSSNWKEQEEAYESQIKHLEQQLKDSKNIIQEQYEQITTHNNNNKHIQQQPSIDMLLLKKKEVNNMNNNNNNINNNNAQLMLKFNEQIRELKLENARIKSSEYKNEQILRLKQKNNKLEERLIKARSEKAKMLPQLLQEKTKLKQELMEMKTTLALYLVKWKFIEKKYQKQLRDMTDDLARYQRKLDTQIKGKRKLGNQMEALDRMAQKTITKAMHERVISAIHVDQLNDNDRSRSYSSSLQKRSSAIANNTQQQQPLMEDEEHKNGIDHNDSYQHQATLPENLRRVQLVIQDLTTKLQKKHDKIGELEKKLAMYELSMSRPSQLGSNNGNVTIPTMMPMNQFMRNQSTSIYGSQTTTDQLPQPNIFGTFAATTTDLNNTMQHQQQQQHPPEALKLTGGNNSSIMPDPNEYDAMAFNDNNDNNGDDNKENMNQFANEEQFLKAFVRKQQQSLAPSPEKTLSIGFFINKKKNIRISVDVNMTFWDILGELNVHQPSNIKNLELHITQNPNPIDENIVITSDWMNKTFWDLILEFGLFQLLKFNVITNANDLKQQTLQVNKQKMKKPSFLGRFKSKKNVSK